MIKVWLISAVAALGGLAVFVGLWLEKIGDLDEYKNIDSFRESKRRQKIGERFVRWGVFAEMLLGFFVATWDGWQAYRNDPLNQPIASVSATEDILVAGNSLNTNSVFGGNPEFEVLSGKVADLGFCEKTNPSVDILVVSDGFARFRIGEPTEYRLNFHMRPDTLSRLSGLELVSVLDKLDTIYLRNFFLPENSDIVGGTITLSLNSSIRTNFIIPHMKSHGYDISLTLSNSNWVPISR